MLNATDLDALRLFNTKAEKLEASTFSQLVSSPSGFGISLRFGGEGEGVLDTGALNQEHIDAFVLTVRFFIQDNERISFRNLATIYSTLPADDPLRVTFEHIRESLNLSLDAPTSIGLPDNLTQRDVLDTVIYGGLAHANAAKQATYERWSRHFLYWGFIFNEFTRALTYLLVAVRLVRETNVKLIAREAA